jgi:hypothetical protein
MNRLLVSLTVLTVFPLAGCGPSNPPAAPPSLSEEEVRQSQEQLKKVGSQEGKARQQQPREP